MAQESLGDKEVANNLIGCFSILWSFCVTTPMWLFLMFLVLSEIEIHTTAWVLFWCYVPSTLINVAVRGFWTLLKD